MPINYDLVVASDWEDVLNSPDHREKFPCESNIGASVDELVILLTVVRNVVGDREAWREARDQLRIEWHSHPDEMKTRKVFVLDTDALNEIAGIDDSAVFDIAKGWLEASDGKIEDPIAAIMAVKRAQAIAAQTGDSTFLKTFEASNAFEQAIAQMDNAKMRGKSETAFKNWNEQKRLDAHLKYQLLRHLYVPDDFSLPAVLDDVNEGDKGATTYAFLGAVRRSIQTIVDSEVTATHEDDEAAVEKFNELLSDDERKRVVCTIAKDVMQSIYHCIEGDNDDASLFRWALVRLGRIELVEPPLSAELHAYLEDGWVFPSAMTEED